MNLIKSTDSVKRKREEEVIVEGNNARKRMKLEEIVLGTLADEKKLDEKSAKKRNKLLTALHLKKKYKYHCKKHDSTYLIESVRKQAKEKLKEKRNDFVQNYRSLSTDTEPLTSSKKESEICNSSMDVDIDHSENEKQDDIIRMIYEENYGSNSKTLKKKQKEKVIKCFIVKKNPIDNSIMFTENKDYIESGLDDSDSDSDSDCDCPYHDRLQKKFSDYKYESSDDELGTPLLDASFFFK